MRPIQILHVQYRVIHQIFSIKLLFQLAIAQVLYHIHIIHTVLTIILYVGLVGMSVDRSCSKPLHLTAN